MQVEPFGQLPERMVAPSEGVDEKPGGICFTCPV